MRLVHIDDLPFETWSSPGGAFQGSGRQLSVALGAQPGAPIHKGGHPFDLEHGRLAPGMTGCPFHSHASQWELFVIRSGEGTVRHGTQRRGVRAGDAILHPPGPEAHQLINTGTTDLDYLLVADNPQVDIWNYPDSDKWGWRPAGGVFRKVPADYYHGEERGAPADARAIPLPEPTPAQRARFVSIASIPEIERRSPRGRYGSSVRDISLALGGVRDTGTWGGGHPFDLQIRRVPPGLAVCPRHTHTLQWEVFLILSGQARVRSGEETHAVRAGHLFAQPPGTPHQILNDGAEPLEFLVVADNPPAEITHYPDSGKWMIRPQGRVFRMTETGYFDGEE